MADDKPRASLGETRMYLEEQLASLITHDIEDKDHLVMIASITKILEGFAKSGIKSTRPMEHISLAEVKSCLPNETAKRELWYRNDLSWLVQPEGTFIWTFLKDVLPPAIEAIGHIIAERGVGKTRHCGLWLHENALKGRNEKYGGRTISHANELLNFTINKNTLEACPEDLRPKWDYTQSKYVFPSGGEIAVVAADSPKVESADRRRGTQTDDAIQDEVAFTSRHKYVRESVIFPRLLRTTGKYAEITTPAVSPAHPVNREIKKLREEKYPYLIEHTIYDNQDYTPEFIAKIAERMGGVNSPVFRREMCNEIVMDPAFRAFPGFEEEGLSGGSKTGELIAGVYLDAQGAYAHVVIGWVASGRTTVVTLDTLANVDHAAVARVCEAHGVVRIYMLMTNPDDIFRLRKQTKINVYGFKAGDDTGVVADLRLDLGRLAAADEVRQEVTETFSWAAWQQGKRELDASWHGDDMRILYAYGALAKATEAEAEQQMDSVMQ